MNHQEIQKLIIPFVDDKLDKKDLEQFLDHMEECTECREEYDIYYTMITGMRLLEEDSIAGTFYLNSDEKLRYAREYLWKYRLIRFVMWAGFGVLVILAIVFFV